MRMSPNLTVGLITLTVVVATVVSGCKKDKDDPETVADIDGNVYKTVVIGGQVWFGENLKTTKYGNGEPIPEVAGETEWLNLISGAYCKYDNNSANTPVYGLLYNWHAVKDSRNVCPDGWHVPTYNDWVTLVDFLGGESVAGGKMKEKGTSHWFSPNTGATDESGFTALPAGYRMGGTFRQPGYYGILWSSTEEDATDGWILNLISSSTQSYLESAYKTDGLSVRCIKD